MGWTQSDRVGMLDGQRKNNEIWGRGMCCSSSGVADTTGKGKALQVPAGDTLGEPKAPLPILYFVHEEAVWSAKF